MNRRIAIPLIIGAASVLTTAVAVEATPASAAATSFTCRVATWPAWNACTGDNVTVRPGQHVYLAVKASGGARVQFRLVATTGGQILANAGPSQTPNGAYQFYWTNTTRYPITIDVQADAASSTPVTVSGLIDVRAVKSGF